LSYGPSPAISSQHSAFSVTSKLIAADC